MITSFPIPAENPHFGGLIRFYFIPVEDIATEPELYKNQLIGDYTFKSGKQLLLGYFDREEAQYNFESSDSDKGSSDKYGFEAQLGANHPEIDTLFTEMKKKKYIVFVADRYKNVRVLGRTDNGAVFSYSFKTNDKIKNAPAYTFKFTYQSQFEVPQTKQITDIC